MENGVALNPTFEKLREIVLGYNKFLLIGHEKPDGDAVGALVALGMYLGNEGKEYRLVSKDNIADLFGYLTDGIKIESDFLAGDYEVIILLDNGDLKRTGFKERILASKKKGVVIINIDHHPQNDIWKIADLNFADPSTPSTCFFLYQYLKKTAAEINRAQATALLSGIYYDTGGFLHQNTSDEVLSATSELLRLGANLKVISKSVTLTRSANMLKLWGVALSKAEIKQNWGVIVSVLTQEEIRSSGADEEEISGLVNLLCSASEARAAILMYETEDDKIKGSIRTEDDSFDASRLAEALGGGGHKKAAGFLIEGKIEKLNNSYRIV
jgi:phosphoesterase RecJ-like protein